MVSRLWIETRNAVSFKPALLVHCTSSLFGIEQLTSAYQTATDFISKVMQSKSIVCEKAHAVPLF
jgi:hypothetical protein